jgi:hypothetical protein
VVGAVGGTVSTELTVIVRAADVAVAPSSSTATAVREYDPAGALVHVTLYGLVESDAMSVVPL